MPNEDLNQEKAPETTLEEFKAEAERLEKVLVDGVDRLAVEELGRVRNEIARLEGKDSTDPTSPPPG